MKLHRETIGSGEKIVLIHGWSFNSNIWAAIVEKLSKQYQVTLIDLPGFGASPMYSYSFDSLLDDVVIISPKKAIYIGWSLGGLITMGLAVRFPQRVKSIVTVGSSPYFLAEKNWPGTTIEEFKAFYGAIKYDPKATLEKFSFSLCSPSEREQYAEQLYKIIMNNGCPSQEALLTGLDILQKTDLRQLVKKLKCPQLHIIGSEDRVTPSSLLSQYYSIIPNAKIQLIEGAGHVPFLTQQSLFLKTLFHFLSALS